MNTSNSCGKSQSFVFIIPDLDTGGGERVTRQLIDALGAQGYSVRLVAKVPETIRAKLPIASHRPFDWSRKLNRFIVIAQELYRCNKETKVVAVLTGPIIATGILNILFGRTLIAYEHSNIEQLYLDVPKFKRMFRRNLLRVAIKSVFRIIVVSEYLRDRLPLTLGCDQGMVAVVPNPVQPFLSKIVCTASVDKEAPLTGYIIGRNAPEKRHADAIELLAASDQVQAIVLVALSAESLRFNLSAKANSKLQIVNDLAKLDNFNVCRCFLFSYSAVESYSLVVGEWLASKLTVIAVGNEPMLRLWSQWRGCYFVPLECSVADFEPILTKALDSFAYDSRPAFSSIAAATTAIELATVLNL